MHGRHVNPSSPGKSPKNAMTSYQAQTAKAASLPENLTRLYGLRNIDILDTL
jgi:hypothetical protein